MIYIIILVAKIVEVSLATIRIVLITKGERLKGALIGFVEVIIWVSIVSNVLSDLTKDPLKIIIYATGFVLGNYLGSYLEEKIGLGTSRMEIIVLRQDGTKLANALRKEGFAVTVVRGEGMNHERRILISHVQRRRAEEYIKIVKANQKNSVITISETKPAYGGYGFKK